MEGKDFELSPDFLNRVSGGDMTLDDMEWIYNHVKFAKSQGTTMDQFLEICGGRQEERDLVRFLWNKF